MPLRRGLFASFTHFVDLFASRAAVSLRHTEITPAASFFTSPEEIYCQNRLTVYTQYTH
jgi:hypothetical protein